MPSKSKPISEEELDAQAAEENPLAGWLYRKQQRQKRRTEQMPQSEKPDKKAQLTIVEDETLTVSQQSPPAKVDLGDIDLADAQAAAENWLASRVHRKHQERRAKNVSAVAEADRQLADAFRAKADVFKAQTELFKEIGDDYHDQLPQHKQDEIELERLRTRNDLRDEKKREEDLKKQAEAGYAGEGGSLEQEPKKDSIAEYSREVQEILDSLARETGKLDPNMPGYEQLVQNLQDVAYAEIEKLKEGYFSE